MTYFSQHVNLSVVFGSWTGDFGNLNFFAAHDLHCEVFGWNHLTQVVVYKALEPLSVLRRDVQHVDPEFRY
jgi:hypothetical protein